MLTGPLLEPVYLWRPLRASSCLCPSLSLYKIKLTGFWRVLLRLCVGLTDSRSELVPWGRPFCAAAGRLVTADDDRYEQSTGRRTPFIFLVLPRARRVRALVASGKFAPTAIV